MFEKAEKSTLAKRWRINAQHLNNHEPEWLQTSLEK